MDALAVAMSIIVLSLIVAVFAVLIVGAVLMTRAEREEGWRD